MSQDLRKDNLFRFLALRPPQKQINQAENLHVFEYCKSISSKVKNEDVQNLEFIKKIHEINSESENWTGVVEYAKDYAYSSKFLVNNVIAQKLEAIYSILNKYNPSINSNLETLKREISECIGTNIGEKIINNDINEFLKIVKTAQMGDLNTTVYELFWQYLYALTIVHHCPSIREQIVDNLRVVNMLEKFLSMPMVFADRKNYLIILNATPIIPTSVFNKKAGLLYAPLTDTSDYLTYSERGRRKSKKPWTYGIARPLGIGDLKVVKQSLARYELGEIAHIENVLNKEYRERKHRFLNRTESSYYSEIETTKETEKDLQTTERFELNKEAQKTIQTDLSFDTGISVTAAYGPTVQVSANANFAISNSQSESNRVSTNYAQDIVSRSIDRVKERVLEERSQKQIQEVEETNTHGFDNKGGDGNIVGIYRWLDKVYKMRVQNYGKRMMYEFIVPEPASFFLYAMNNKKVPGMTLIEPDEPEPINGGRKLTPEDITESNYTHWITKYNIQDISPPLPLHKFVETSFSMQDSHPACSTDVSKRIVVPEHYKANQVSAGGSGRPSKDGGTWHLIVGCVWMAAPQLGVFYPMNGEDGEIPVSFYQYDFDRIAINIVVQCERTEKCLKEWQLKTYSSIISAYQRLKSEYENQLASAGISPGSRISGQSPEANRSTEKQELKKSCIYLLRKKPFNNDCIDEKNRLRDDYPEINIPNTIIQGNDIQFFEQAFEWEQSTYLLYPYFWGRRDNWLDKMNTFEIDPIFAKFLQAGAARVVVPVRPGYELSLAYYLTTGTVWNGGNVPVIGDEMYVSIISELKSQATDINEDLLTGEEWEVKIPTSLVILQEDSTLPVVEE